MTPEEAAAATIRAAARGCAPRVVVVLEAMARWLESGARPSPTPQAWDAMDGMEVRDGI